MRFADPMWLWVGACVTTLLFILLVRAEVLKTRVLRLLAGSRQRLSKAAVPSPFKRRLRVLIVTVSVALGFVALARPQKGMHWETTTRKGTDIMLVVDTSKSMDADDIKPTRLERIKLAIRDLVERIPGDRVGLVAFAGDALVQSPMTLDHAALLEVVDALDSSVVGRGGTNLEQAIAVASAALQTEPDHRKSVVLISDGEGLEGNGLEQARKAAAEGITIDTVGVGTAAGELVPERDLRGRVTGIVTDEQGNAVRSHLDEASLTAIASAAGGHYFALGADGKGLDRVYAEQLAKRERVEASSRTRRVYSEWYAVPLGLSLLGIVLYAMLGTTWRSRRRRPRLDVASAGALGALAGVLTLVTPGQAHASAWSASRAYEQGRYDEAAEQYEAASLKDPTDARLAYNAGDAAYKAKQYAAAGKAFERALKVADPALRQHVLFNHGDTLYRLGETQLNKDRAKTIARWKASIAAFEKAMKLDPKDKDARFNRDFVRRKLKELEEQEKKDNEHQQTSGQQGQKGQQDQKQKNGQQDQKQNQGQHDQKQKNGQQGKSGEQDQKQNQGQQDQKQKNSQQDRNPGARDSKKNGAGQPGTAQPPKGSHDTSASQSQPGAGLSPKDARALLDAVRGEERGAPRPNPAGQQTPDNTPQKDW